jgi:hypothetical protein
MPMREARASWQYNTVSDTEEVFSRAMHLCGAGVPATVTWPGDGQPGVGPGAQLATRSVAALLDLGQDQDLRALMLLVAAAARPNAVMTSAWTLSESQATGSARTPWRHYGASARQRSSRTASSWSRSTPRHSAWMRCCASRRVLATSRREKDGRRRGPRSCRPPGRALAACACAGLRVVSTKGRAGARASRFRPGRGASPSRPVRATCWSGSL